MGLFQQIFGPRGQDKQGSQWATLNNYTTVSFQPWGGDLFESDLVRASIDARARHISKLSVLFYGSAQPALQTKLKQAPNAWQSWSQFLYRLSVVLDMRSTAFIVPVYNRAFERQGISIAIPQDFQLVDVSGTPWIRMRFANGDVASDELGNIGIMTKFQYLSDYFGTGNTALEPVLELIDIQRQGIQAAAKNSATYKFMATLNNFAKSEDLAKERERFSKENLRSGDGGMLLFPNTYKDIKEIDHKPYSVDADQQKAIQDRIFYYFGVNEKILTNAAGEEELEAFYEGAIEPFGIQLADVLTKMLFTSNEISYENQVQFSSDRLAYMSMANKINLIQQMGDRGQLMQNEARRIANLPDIPGGNRTTIRGEYKVIQYDDNGNLINLDDEYGGDYEDAEDQEDFGEDEEEIDEANADEETDAENDEDMSDLMDQMAQELEDLEAELEKTLDSILGDDERGDTDGEA